MNKNFRKASPMIFAVLSIAGLIGTAVTAAKGAVKAQEEPDKDKVTVIWKYYIPTFICGTTTAACIIGIAVTSKRNQAGLTAAYAMLAENFRQYREAAKQLYGEDADSKIIAEIARKPELYSQGLISTSSLYLPDDDKSEEVLFYDMYARRYFTSTLLAVVNAQYHINRNLSLRGYVSLNEYYDFLGIDHVEHGDEIGWSIDELCLEWNSAWLDFDNKWTQMEDSMECYVITFQEPTCFDGDLDI